WYGLEWFNHVGAIGDIDGDSRNEVLSVAQDGKGGEYANGIVVTGGWGQEYWRKGFSRTAEDMPGIPLLRDLNGDGKLDVLVGAERRIFAFASDGTEMWTLGNEPFFQVSPDIFAFDIDKDGDSEMIFQNDSVIYELSPNGTASEYCAFPQDSRLITRKAKGLGKDLLVSGDLDGDGFEELVVEERAPDGYHVAVLSERVTEVKITIDVDPDTLNLKSKGRWVTAYLSAENASVHDIDTPSLLLQDTLPPERWDYQDDVLMLKFNRQDLIAILEVGESVEIKLSGKWIDGTAFEAYDCIRVINPGK
ncbi:MAG: VCBS repeat-containing protein, partial [Thermoplasmata archaeon]